MVPTLRSERVALTPVEVHEAAEIWELIRTPPVIVEFPDPKGGPEVVARWIAQTVAEGWGVWVVRHDGDAFGMVTADLRAPATAVVGYAVDEAWIADELAADALNEVVRWLFEVRRCHRVELRVATGSLALWRVAQRAGFVLEGVARESWRWNGAWHDARTYALLEREWRAARACAARATSPIMRATAG
ncbi:MAG: N-acetyltransferase [Deltaproteobacteria bacterium]|nr:MAG: N-acetyltransferase [Deltaproteobacteria bacterium]